MANPKCKYKDENNERLCMPLHGECQFILCRYGPKCPIFHMLELWRKLDPEGFMLLVGEFDEGLLVSEDGQLNLTKED